jgi:hypothetical protein
MLPLTRNVDIGRFRNPNISGDTTGYNLIEGDYSMRISVISAYMPMIGVHGKIEYLQVLKNLAKLEDRLYRSISRHFQL